MCTLRLNLSTRTPSNQSLHLCTRSLPLARHLSSAKAVRLVAKPQQRINISCRRCSMVPTSGTNHPISTSSESETAPKSSLNKNSYLLKSPKSKLTSLAQTCNLLSRTINPAHTGTFNEKYKDLELLTRAYRPSITNEKTTTDSQYYLRSRLKNSEKQAPFMRTGSYKDDL